MDTSIDSDDDDDVSDLFDFCANCHRKQSGNIQFKRCSKCQMSKYCRVSCELSESEN